MLLKPYTSSLVLFLGLLVALLPLSTDIFVPTMPAIGDALGADVSAVQLTMTTFFVGVACGQLIYGPVSDRYGRRAPLLAGLALYLAGSLYCATAGSIEALVTGRFLQGLGVSAATVVGRAIVRDLHAWDKAAHMLALMAIPFGIVPVIAPLVGAGMLLLWGWAAPFWLVAALASVMLALVALNLPETAPAPRAGAMNAAALARDFAFLLGERHFLAYMAVLLLVQIGVLAIVTHSSIVFITALGYSVENFAALFAVVMIGFVTGSVLGSRLVLRRGIDRTIYLGTMLNGVSGVMLAAAAWAQADSVLAMGVPMFVFTLGTSLVVPHATAAAMSPYPKIAGAASSLSGFLQVSSGAMISYLLGVLFDGTARPMSASIALVGVASLAVYAMVIRRLQPHPSRVAP